VSKGLPIVGNFGSAYVSRVQLSIVPPQSHLERSPLENGPRTYDSPFQDSHSPAPAFHNSSIPVPLLRSRLRIRAGPGIPPADKVPHFKRPRYLRARKEQVSPNNYYCKT
jgi:hypothetical protein